MFTERIIAIIPTAYQYDAGVVTGLLLAGLIYSAYHLFNKYIHIGN